jgi:hypothetical protein
MDVSGFRKYLNTMKTSDKPQMLIANRLRDGLTVFLAADGGWVAAIADGAVARDAAQAASLLQQGEAAARQNVVVGPYLIAIGEEDGDRRPLEWREAIRAFGPTVETRASS